MDHSQFTHTKLTRQKLQLIARRVSPTLRETRKLSLESAQEKNQIGNLICKHVQSKLSA